MASILPTVSKPNSSICDRNLYKNQHNDDSCEHPYYRNNVLDFRLLFPFKLRNYDAFLQSLQPLLRQRVSVGASEQPVQADKKWRPLDVRFYEEIPQHTHEYHAVVPDSLSRE